MTSKKVGQESRGTHPSALLLGNAAVSLRYELQFVVYTFTAGPKLISLNERQRGFPTGLRVMASDKHDSCLLEVDSSLEKARFRGGAEMVVRQVEVWGCGGVEAMESQRRVKKWEEGEILRRRKVGLVT